MAEVYKLKRKSARIILKVVTDTGLRAIPIVDGILTDESAINEVYPGELLWNSTDGNLSTIDVLGNTVEFNVNAQNLAQLNDVDFSTLPTDGQVMKYNESLSVWQPADESGGGGASYTFTNGIKEDSNIVSLPTVGDTLSVAQNTYIGNVGSKMGMRWRNDSIALGLGFDFSMTPGTDNLILVSNNGLAVNTRSVYIASVLALSEGNQANFFMPKDFTDRNILKSGTTAERPTDVYDFEQFFDTDLGYAIVYNGTNWVNSTGAIV